MLFHNFQRVPSHPFNNIQQRLRHPRLTTKRLTSGKRPGHTKTNTRVSRAEVSRTIFYRPIGTNLRRNFNFQAEGRRSKASLRIGMTREDVPNSMLRQLTLNATIRRNARSNGLSNYTGFLPRGRDPIGITRFGTYHLNGRRLNVVLEHLGAHFTRLQENLISSINGGR